MPDADEFEVLRLENASLRRVVSDLAKRQPTSFGLVWEREEWSAENDTDRPHLLDYVAEEGGRPISDSASDPGNLIIEGNNLNALRLLLGTHAGKVDCIFIDPPYGSGNETWMYNNAFVNPKHKFKDSGWLSWFEPRIELARDLLSSAGCLIMCIDDSKRAVSELLLEAMMPGKRVGSLVWRTRQGANDRGIKMLSGDHEHLIVYANKDFEFGGVAKTYALYKYYDEKLDDYYRIADMTVNVAYDDKRAGKAYYHIHDPKTDTWYPCNPNAVWRFGSSQNLGKRKKNRKATMEELVAADRLCSLKSAISSNGPQGKIWTKP